MNNKTCPRCSIKKLLVEFYTRKENRPSAYCKICTVAEGLERQRRLKIQCINYKGGKCIKCGYDKYPSAFDFHHIDPNKKDFSISGFRRTSFSNQIKNELDKCILVCCRCHREIHTDIINTTPSVKAIRSPKELKQSVVKLLQRYCIDCGVKISMQSTRCKKCVPKKHKIHWPPVDELITMVNKLNYCAVGRKLGVSDTAIRKHIKNYR